MAICKACGREISMFSLFNGYVEKYQCCEQCLEKEIEKGNITLLGSLFELEE